MPQTEMTQSDLIRNMAYCTKKPFTSEDVVNMCAIEERYARHLLKKLVETGEISISKRGEHGLHVYVWGSGGHVKLPPSHVTIYNILYHTHQWLRKNEIVERTGLTISTIERWLPALLIEKAVLVKYVDGNLAYYTAIPNVDLTNIKTLREYGIRND